MLFSDIWLKMYSNIFKSKRTSTFQGVMEVLLGWISCKIFHGVGSDIVEKIPPASLAHQFTFFTFTFFASTMLLYLQYRCAHFSCCSASYCLYNALLSPIIVLRDMRHRSRKMYQLTTNPLTFWLPQNRSINPILSTRRFNFSH